MVQDSQSSNPTITKLLEVDVDLAGQEAQLSAQLVSIQQKRHSLKTVIDMFAPVDTADTVPTATPTQTPVVAKAIESAASEVALSNLNDTMTDTTESVALLAPQPQKRQAKKNSSPTNSKPGKKSTSTKELSKNTNTWQQYVKDEFSNISLAEAVAQVMQQHSEQVLEIATVIDTIFASDITKELKSTARERVSNVLSVGTKKGNWCRGRLGKYSMSKAAVER